MAGQAVTLLKNENNILPFKLSNGKKIVLLAPWQDRLNLMKESLMQIISKKSLQIDIKEFAYTDLVALNDEQKKAIAGADYVVLGSSSSDVNSRTPGKNWTPDYVLNAVNYCREQHKQIAVIAIRNPYDIMYVPDVPAYICIYGRAEGPDIPAGIMAIFGELNPRGKLPVAIPNTEGGTLYPLGSGLSYDSGANKNPAGSPRILLNDQYLSLNPSPFLENGRCIVPLRVVEAMGGEVSWDQKQQKATVSWPGNITIIKAGASSALVNNQYIPVDVEARLRSGCMLVPLRFIAQISGAEVRWDGTTSSISLQLPTEAPNSGQ
ncbi:MAG: stalk domain-containing protein [Bacillota bacterium]